MTGRVAALLLGLSLAVAACAIAALDYTGKTCPCPAPWSCDEDAGVCRNTSGGGGGPPDGATDANADTGSTDGGLDAPNDASWCQLNAPDAYFCCDFDHEKQLIDDEWLREQNPGTTLDTMVYKSPFQSLRAAPPSVVPDGGTYAAYVRQPPSTVPATALHLGFDLLVGDVPDGAFVTVAQLGLAPPDASITPPPRSLAILVYGNGAYVQEQVLLADGGKATNTWMTTSAPATGTGTWSHVEIDVVLDSDAGTGMCSLLVDSTQALSKQLTPGWTSEPSTMAVGLIYSQGPLVDASVNIDNVTWYVH